MKFKNFSNFESILKQVDHDQPWAVGYYFICSYDESKSYYRDHAEDDSPVWFCKREGFGWKNGQNLLKLLSPVLSVVAWAEA